MHGVAACSVAPLDPNAVDGWESLITNRRSVNLIFMAGYANEWMNWNEPSISNKGSTRTKKCKECKGGAGRASRTVSGFQRLENELRWLVARF